MEPVINKHCAQVIGAFVQSWQGKKLAARAMPQRKLNDAQWAQLLDQCGDSINAALDRAYQTRQT